MRRSVQFLAEGGLGDHPLERLLADLAALIGSGFLTGGKVARRLRHRALVFGLEGGISMVSPPTLATQVGGPIRRKRSLLIPHPTNDTAMRTKNRRAIQESV